MKPSQFTMFKKSQPWGYYPPEVEAKILQYERALSNVNDKVISQKQQIMAYKDQIDKLQEELRKMHLEMSSLELPEADEAIEHYVLDDFKHYNNPSNEHPFMGSVMDSSNDSKSGVFNMDDEPFVTDNLTDNSSAKQMPSGKSIKLRLGKKNKYNDTNDGIDMFDMMDPKDE